jgi:hypothetical protein
MKKHKKIIPFLLLVALCATGAWASQPSKFWVVPALGIRTSTSFGITSEEVEYTRIRFASGAAYGLSVGFQLSEYLSIEAMWSRQNASIQGMIPGEDVPSYEPLFKAFEDQLHANLIIWAGYKIGPVKPYFLAGAGLARLNPRTDYQNLSRFSWSVGMGFETRISGRFGLRIQGKFLPIYINTTDEIISEWVGGFEASPARNTMTHWEFKAGLIVHF